MLIVLLCAAQIPSKVCADESVTEGRPLVLEPQRSVPAGLTVLESAKLPPADPAWKQGSRSLLTTGIGMLVAGLAIAGGGTALLGTGLTLLLLGSAICAGQDVLGITTAAVGGVTSLTGAVLIGEGRYQTRYHEQRAAAASRPPSQVAATGDRRVALMPYLLSPVGAGVTTSSTW